MFNLSLAQQELFWPGLSQPASLEKSVVKFTHRFIHYPQCNGSALNSISRGIVWSGKGFILDDISVPSLEHGHSYMCSLASSRAIEFLGIAKRWLKTCLRLATKMSFHKALLSATKSH